jgi:ribosome-associated protein
MTVENLALQAAKLLYDKLGEDVVVLRVAHLTVLADFLVIATGRSAIQARAMADHLEEQLAAQSNLKPRRVEGRNDASWIVLDYLNVIVHIFKPEARSFYRLERLWDDGQNRLALPFDSAAQA